MKGLVIDSSVAASWILPDETNEAATRWLEAALTKTPVAPAHWPVEIANTALQAHRRGRLSESDLDQAWALLSDLDVQVEASSLATTWRDGLSLARRHSLTVYDALYLELALRRGFTLATFDKALLRAASETGVAVEP